MIRSIARLPLAPGLVFIALAACAVSEAKAPDEIGVELASVTLAEDCGTEPPAAVPAPAPPSKPAPAADRSKPSGKGPSAGGCATPGTCGGPHRQCEQTSMQLAFKAQPGVKPTTIKIKKVELLDTKGKVLEVLTARAPTQWTATTGAYAVWNETIGSGDTIKTSYALSAPNWDKLTNGRMNANSHTFQLRVTITVGSANRTVEKTAITPARVAPPVVT